MSQSLGEKLRFAREERGISITEVAEATRISPHYLQAIEVDDYRTLPGGIFNKGFIKSFAKYVGVDEASALADYARIINADGGPEAAEPASKHYRPEVLTDDRAGGSMIPTVIAAVVILAIVTAAVLFGLNYLKNRQAEPVANSTSPNANTNSNPAIPAATPQPAVPSMASLKVEFSATTDPVSVTASLDGGRSESKLIAAGATETFEPKESLKLSYSRSLAQVVKLSINGKPITLPATPTNPKRSVIEFQIDKDTLPAIWASASISGEVPAEPAAAENTAGQPATAAPPTSTPAPAEATPKPEAAAATPKPSVAPATPKAANTAATPATTGSPAKRPATGTKAPEAAPTKKPAGAETH